MCVCVSVCVCVFVCVCVCARALAPLFELLNSCMPSSARKHNQLEPDFFDFFFKSGIPVGTYIAIEPTSAVCSMDVKTNVHSVT